MQGELRGVGVVKMKARLLVLVTFEGIRLRHGFGAKIEKRCYGAPASHPLGRIFWGQGCVKTTGRVHTDHPGGHLRASACSALSPPTCPVAAPTVVNHRHRLRQERSLYPSAGPAEAAGAAAEAQWRTHRAMAEGGALRQAVA